MGENEYVMVLLPKGTYFMVKGTGVDIWDLLVEQKTQSEIIDVLIKRYNCDYVTVKKSVEKFISELETEGVITLL